MNERSFAALWIELLSVSIADAERCGDHLARGFTAKSTPLIQEGLEAIEWIFYTSLKDRSRGSFAFVCDLLGADPVVVRRKLAQRPSIQVAGKHYRQNVLKLPTKGVVKSEVCGKSLRIAA